MALPLRAALVLTAALLLVVAAPASAQDPNGVLPEAPAKAVILRACTGCHQPTVIVAKSHTADEWDEIVGKMIGRGAELTDAEQDQIIAYLAKNFAPQAPTSPAPTSTPGGAVGH